MPKFMIVLTENDNAWSKLGENERKSLLEKYYAWVGQLKSEDRLKGGEPLAKGGKTLEARDGQVHESAYAETRDVLTGFFVIAAEDLAEATRIAHGCPALLHGEKVIIRPVADYSSDHAGA